MAREGGWQPLHRDFEWWAEHAGDRVAITDATTGKSTTYRTLNSNANQLAYHLADLGVAPGQLVGIATERGAELLTALLAVLKAGGGYVPLDPGYPQARLAQVISDCALRVVVGQAAHRAMVDSGSVRFVDMSEPGISREPEDDLAWKADAQDPMYVIHTSGSTGKPKGVVVPHVCVPRLFSMTRASLGFSHDDVWTGLHSFAFDFSVWEIWGALAHGGRYVVVSHETVRDPQELWSVVVDQGVTVLNQTPTAFRLLSTAALSAEGTPGALRLIVFGGEQLNPIVLAPWMAAYGDRGPRLINMYGITETTVHVTLREIRTSDTALADSPIGVPLDDLRVRLLDSDLAPTAPGGVGEMFVSGAGVTAGYLNRPDLTAARFLEDPDGPPGKRMYRTGDLARQEPSGDLIFCGRVDRQVQVRGYRIEPGEVEALLSRVPGVRECAVVPRRDDAGELELVAYVALTARADPRSVRRALAEMAPAHLLPRAIVPVEVLPLTSQGKLDVDALPAPRPVSVPRSDDGTAPELITSVCAAVLGVEEVGEDDDFFALGGDSMRAVQLVQSLRDAGYAATVASVYRTPILRDLAADIAQSSPADTADDTDDTPVPLSATQIGVLYDCDMGDDTLYRVLAAIHLSGPCNRDALTSALQDLTARHEVLNHGFDLAADDGPVHRVRGSVDIPLTVSDTDDSPDAILDRRAGWAAAIDSEREPLLHCHVVRYRDGSHHLALVVHHALLDGWSLSLVAADLVALYRERLGGAPADLSHPAPGRTARHARLEEQRRTDPAARAFWHERLSRVGAGITPAGHLPLVQARDSIPGEPVVDVARRLGVPAKCVFAAAHVWATGRMTNARKPVVGMVANTRPEEPGADLAVGMFVNLLPFAANLQICDSWAELIRAVFAWERDVLAHRWVAMSDLVEWTAGPLFDSVFTYTEPRALAHIDYAPLKPRSDWVFANETAFAVYTDIQRGPLTDMVALNTQLRSTDTCAASRMLKQLNLAIKAICADAEAIPDSTAHAEAATHNTSNTSTGTGLASPPTRR
ncbi:non-ribosomal peptide synthase [Amycolatopsis azurea DSM 43854]|uniref:Long-chain-fatty-acid--CoA ligase n=2 Tax=Amycolatopsis azurea TaxID=36819 RepID=M2PVU7_9PSEU|nr:Long-chain-fatty-acid--CoA ligase [Amycolatopsis azurea DSM 43854]OOC02953.1 non-ribosomal peptide synthase [Amycolatopsis azurea DSM 43854]